MKTMLNDSSDKAVSATSDIKKGTATFADNVFTLSSAATIALGISILASPVTSRLFGPEAFGIAALFRSGATMLGAIVCLRYEMAIVLPKNDGDAAHLFVLSCLALMAMTTLTAILTCLFGSRILLYMNALELKPILWLFPICVFLLGLQLLLNSWYTRQKRFKITAANRILNSLPISMAEISGGLAGFRSGGNLAVIRILGLIISPGFLVWRLLSGDARFIVSNLNYGGILKSAKRYIKFPLFDSWSTLLIQLAWHVPVILLTSLFSPAIGGLYAKSLYLLTFPSIIIGQSVSQVFLQESAVSWADGRSLAGMVEAVLNRMIAIGILPFTVLAIIGPEFFELMLGSRWTEAGVYTQILTPQLFVVFSVGTINSLFGTLGKQELLSVLNALTLILQIVILIYGGLLLRDVRVTLFILMVGNVSIGLWKTSLLMRATKLSARRPLAHFLRCVAYSLPSIIPIAAMKWWFNLEAIYLVAAAPVFSIPYVALVLGHDLELRNLFAKYLRKIRSLL